MFNYIRADESHLVLIFVVAPLLLLLVAGIFLWVRYTPRSSAKFPTFSVSLSKVHREVAYIYYRDDKKRLEFYAGPADRKHVYLSASKELSVEDLREVVPNLAKGLAELGFQHYTIRTQSENQILVSGPQKQNGDSPS
jgi:hypothetical protein